MLVIGAGVAGVAAAHAAEQRGAQVTLVHDRAGATELSSGALDWLGWEQDAPRRGAWVSDTDGALEEGAAAALPAALLRFSDALGAWQLSDAPARVVTTSGFTRPARGVQRGVLDVRALAGRRVAVPLLPRADWDGEALCRALAQDAALARLRIRFTPLQVNVLRFRAEEVGSSRDLAAAHDAEERVRWLAEQLRPHAAEAWLMGPWLGLHEAASGALSEALGVPVGETLSDLGQAAGARLGAALARLARRHARVVQARVTLLERDAAAPDGAGWRAHCEAPDGAMMEPLRAARVVLASGGLGAGGLTLTPTQAGVSGGARLGVSFAAALRLELDGAPLSAASSLHGFEFERRGRLALERLGLARVPAPGLLSAGDARAGEPRTLLQSAYTGLLAGAASALREPGSSA